MYAKVFAQIFDSSIADDFRLRHFFMDLLVLADVNGVVDMTPTSIAARTRIPLEDVSAMLAKLEQPDQESRTPEADGRRIERLDEHRTWGWHIINYSRFREIASEQQRREKTRERVASFRQKRQQKPAGNMPVTPGNACNAMQRQMKMQKQRQRNESFPPIGGEKSDSRSAKSRPLNQEDSVKSRLEEFVSLWSAVYVKAFGRKCTPPGVSARKQLVCFLGRRDETPAELVEIARLAWTYPKGYHSRNARTIAGFCGAFDAILPDVPTLKLNDPEYEKKARAEHDAAEKRGDEKAVNYWRTVLHQIGNRQPPAKMLA